MKRFLFLVMALYLGLALIGCSNRTDDSTIEETNEKIDEPVSNVASDSGIMGTWKTTYNGTDVVLAINEDGTYEFYQDKNKHKILISGTYTDANDTLSLTPNDVKEDSNEEFDFKETTTIPYTLNGNELHTSINNQHIVFNRELPANSF